MIAREAAETIAAEALAFLAQEPETLVGFLTASGVGPSDLRARAGDPEALAAVLDYVRSDESVAAAFCESRGLAPEQLTAARAALPGGDAPSWT